MTNPTSKRQRNDEPVSGKPKPLWKKILKFMFSHVGLCILLFIYVLVGAAIFIGIEGGKKSTAMETAGIAVIAVEAERNNTETVLKDLHGTLGDLAAQKSKVLANLLSYEAKVRQVANATGVDAHDAMTGSATHDPWTFSAATLFTVSIITLVGYGNVYPVTTAGMVAVIVYGLIGIPLTLIFLANLGDLMAMVVKKLTGGLRRRLGGGDTVADVNDAEPKKVGKGQLVVLLMFPIFLTVMIMVFFMLLGALIFWGLEGWSILVGVYFCLQTFTTIGFGDYAPGWGREPNVEEAFKQIFTVLFIFCGLAFIAMGLNLIADEIIKYSKSVSRKLGWDDEEREIRKGNIDRAVRRNQNMRI